VPGLPTQSVNVPPRCLCDKQLSTALQSNQAYINCYSHAFIRNTPHVDFDGLAVENQRDLIQATDVHVRVCIYLQVHREAEFKVLEGVLLHKNT
jgi:hypothetical protein